MRIPSPTPQLSLSISQQELIEHRKNIGYEVEIVLDGYWQNRPTPEIKAGILADWMDDLQDWHIDQIRWALRKWRSINPSKKPNPGHIVGILKAQRGQVHAGHQMPEQARQIFAISRPALLEAAQ